MHPKGRHESEFNPQGGANHQKSDNQHDKHRRSVSGISKAVIKTALRAAVINLEKTVKQPAFTALWTFAPHGYFKD